VAEVPAEGRVHALDIDPHDDIRLIVIPTLADRL
jgi:hypothetical protein